MKIGFYLTRPNAEKSSVDCIVSINGRYKRSTRISVETKHWDSAKMRVREVISYPAAREINKALKKYAEAVEAIVEQLNTEFDRPTSKQFWLRVDVELTGGTSRKTLGFVEYFAQYTERRKKKGAISTGKKYGTTLTKLQEFEHKAHTSLSFRDINIRFYAEFKSFIIGQGYSLNYFGSLTRCIKVAYRDARDVDGLHNFHETAKRGFSAPSVAAKTIYLTNEELQKIADVEITVETLRVSSDKYNDVSEFDLIRKVEALNLSRNKFIVGAYTALRVSDFNHLRNVHISDGFFRVNTQKTGAAVVIPIHPTIRKLIDSGFDISTPISEQKINKHIKEVARLAGITQPVEATKLVNHRAVVDWWPKCDVITTHTARRSAATNMYKAGIPTISIMRITGHTTEKSFMKYIKITNEENAELMARNKYFM